MASHHGVVVVQIDIAADGVEVGDNLPLEMEATPVSFIDAEKLRSQRLGPLDREVGVAEDIMDIANGANFAAEGDDVLDELRDLLGLHQFHARFLVWVAGGCGRAAYRETRQKCRV